MKTILSALALLSSFGVLLAGPATAPAASAPKCHACCAAANAEPATTEVKTLSAQSIYQLDATWTNDAGVTATLASLRGRPVVLAMFFAQCEYACPVLVSDMQRLRQCLPAEVRDQAQFVLVSFDTARDTPAALKAYRERDGLDASWTLLRGDAGAVQELAMLLGVKFKQDARGQFSHSNLITVLNREGEVAFQRAGLLGDVSETAKAVAVVAQR
jgi:protein SCO1/2